MKLCILLSLGVLLMPLCAATTTTAKSAKQSDKKLRGSEDDSDENPDLRVAETPECVQEEVLYEDPTDTENTFFSDDLAVIILNSKPLFLDEDLTEIYEYADAVCNAVGEGRYMCSVITTSDFGSAAGTGVVEFDDFGFGTGLYVLNGGTDMNAGLTGKVESEYTPDLITHSVCVQVPPAIPLE